MERGWLQENLGFSLGLPEIAILGLLAGIVAVVVVVILVRSNKK